MEKLEEMQWSEHCVTGGCQLNGRERFTKLWSDQLLYGAETWATTRGQEARLEVNEMRMLRWMCGVTRRDKIRNKHIRGTTRVVRGERQRKLQKND